MYFGSGIDNTMSCSNYHNYLIYVAMKNFVIKSKVNLVLVLISLMMVSFSDMFAGRYELLEPKTNTLITPTNLDFVIDFISRESDEELMEIEFWMLNSDEFIENSVNDLEWEEFRLNVEPWMLSVESFIEEYMPVEDWMTDVDSFLEVDEPELVLEDWMLDVDAFINTSSSDYALR